MRDSLESLRIRTAEPSDIPMLVPMINAAFAVVTFLEGTRTDEARLAALMAKGTILAAEDADSKFVASVYVEQRGCRGYLGMLAVDPAQQGRGLARAMVVACEDHFRALGCEAIEITVLSLRPELLPIYRRLGFTETGTEEFHPGRPLKAGVECHCIVMSKDL